ncbi:MAG: bifunctional UDP-N-acetylmuramoyl-tripeptide:D-alanyl-D-alanine ligase/alanine racemase [Cytophagales bacterium]|nr:MAG: bifunctional UDP-N-acetylmuramoyl-tripeptide:D-alanyl-D-alanine ligase/alanine racemase [Cytophagales bacterium]
MSQTIISAQEIGNVYELYKNYKILTDSRKWASPENTLFVALKGDRHNGHEFIVSLYERGFRHFIVSEKPSRDLENAQLIVVPNTLHFLQTLAQYKRSQMPYPVVGITGSNGKTVVKEWLGQLLSPYKSVVKSPKSFNSQLGVAISVWQMTQKHEVAVFEAGISTTNEMQRLEAMIQPTIGIFTNIGSAHDEGFENRLTKIEEKAKLFQNCQTLIYSSDYPILHTFLAKNFAPAKLVAWTFAKQENAVRIEKSTFETHATVLTFRFRQKDYRFILPFQDQSSLENALHTIFTALLLGLNAQEIQQGLQHLHRLDMRLSLKEGQNQSLIIDDTYSNDLDSLPVALDFLNEQAANRPHKLAILSQPAQMGLSVAELELETQKIALEKGISELWYVSTTNATRLNQSLLPTRYFADTAMLISALKAEPLSKDYVVLIKGARKYEFEQVVKLLDAKQHDTVLEISLEAISHNLNFYKRQLSPHTKLMVMVKALAYGSGYKEVAQLMAYHSVHYLAVAYTDEGVYLRQHGIRLPIMVLNPLPESFDLLLAHNLEPEIYSLRILCQWISFLNKQHSAPKHAIHLKLDTGMRRLGFEEDELVTAVLQIKACATPIHVASVFTHLAASESPAHEDFTRLQIAKFQAGAKALEALLGYKPLLHVLNSAGIVKYPEFHFDMVRLGMGLYGVETSETHIHDLRAISSLKTHISQIKHIKKGETVGYGRRGVAQQDMRIATVAIGYADGYDRRFGLGNGQMLVNGHLVPTIGSICMDMCMLALGDAPAQEGDEVLVFGEELPIQQLANNIGTIAYEVLTNVGYRVKRVFYW